MNLVYVQGLNHMIRKYSLIIILFVFSVNAQEKLLWAEQKGQDIISRIEVSNKEKYKVYTLDKNDFLQSLKVSSNQVKRKVSFPSEKGEEAFWVEPNPVLSPKLQEKFPQLSSYVGKSVKGNKTVYFSTSPYGVNAVFYENGKKPIYIDPIGKNYIMYRASSKKKYGFTCNTQDIEKKRFTKDNSKLYKRANNDNQLRIFRLALAVTGEYSQYHLNLQGVPNTATEQDKKTAVLSALQNAVLRVNSIYERDLSIHFNLVDNNDLLIFLDPEKDGFTNNDGYQIAIKESKKIIDDAIGFDNYDIGHIFSTGVGGIALPSSVCTNGKNQGVTGMLEPKGDPFHIDYVCHEIGHQFGATHTFNGDTGDCSGENRNNPTAYEPGSGSTIMGYAGICAPENIQKNSDPYFHYISIQQIVDYVTTLSCPEIKNINNTEPKVDGLTSYVLPISTPFALKAKATDAEKDHLTYTWEQLDNQIVSVPLQSTEAGGPAFRSIMPTDDGTRYFPNISTVMNNKLKNTWEVLPSVSRDMHFVVTVRDNHAGGGRTSSQKMTLSFTEEAGPFKVVSQGSSEKWQGGTLQTITWDVANTNKNPVNCSKVSILLSDDGGKTFSHTLAENVSNDGEAVVFAPNINTKKGRIKVKSEKNVFYAVNKAEIEIIKTNLSGETKFFIKSKDQICPSKQNGSITITANKEANYKTVIGGKTYSFKKSLFVENMKANTYDFCISATGIKKQCFKKTILGGSTIKVSEKLKYPKYQITVEKGAAPYRVFKNDKELFKTSEKTIEVEVKNGDVIKVQTSETCEGVYQKEILAFEEVRAFPNPTSGKFEISIPKTKLSKVKVTLFDFTGKVISQKKYNVFAKRISLDISYLPNGIYIAFVEAEDKKGIKIIKQ